MIEIEIEVAIKTRATDIAHATMTEAETEIGREAVTVNGVQGAEMMIDGIPETIADVTIRKTIGEMTEGMIEELIDGTRSGTIEGMINGTIEGMIEETTEETTLVMIDGIFEETETETVGATETEVLPVVIETMSRLTAMCLDARSVQWCKFILSLSLLVEGDLDVRRVEMRKSIWGPVRPRSSQSPTVYPNACDN